METIRVGLSMLHRRRPVTELSGHVDVWSVPNAAGHAKMLELSGFEILRRHVPYAVPLGRAHRELTRGSLRGALRTIGPSGVARGVFRNVVAKMYAGRAGDVHSALLTRPRS
jgi:hypothetical protein